MSNVLSRTTIKIGGFTIKTKELDTDSNTKIAVSIYKDGGLNLSNPILGTILSTQLKAEQWAILKISELINQ